MVLLDERNVALSSLAGSQVDPFEFAKLDGLVLLFLLLEEDGEGGGDVVLIVFTDADLSEVLHEVFDVDPEDAIICFFEVELLS